VLQSIIFYGKVRVTLPTLQAHAKPEVSNWLDETQHLLRDRPASLTMNEIAKELDVSPAWLYGFLNGTIKNPGVVTTNALNKLLKNRIKACR